MSSARDLLEAYNAAKMMMTKEEGEDKADMIADLLVRASRSLLKAAKTGDIDECRELLAIEGVDIHIKDRPEYPNHGNTPVMLACKYGHLDILEYLVSKGANIDYKNNNDMNCLMWACANYHSEDLAKYLMSKGANIYEMNNYGATCFSFALHHNRIRLLYRLRKWPTTMTILVLKELALIYIIDSESVIDLHQYLGRPEDLKTDN